MDIAPIYKEDDKHNANYYGGVTLMDKVFQIYNNILKEKVAEKTIEI